MNTFYNWRNNVNEYQYSFKRINIAFVLLYLLLKHGLLNFKPFFLRENCEICNCYFIFANLFHIITEKLVSFRHRTEIIFHRIDISRHRTDIGIPCKNDVKIRCRTDVSLLTNPYIRYIQSLSDVGNLCNSDIKPTSVCRLGCDNFFQGGNKKYLPCIKSDSRISPFPTVVS